MHMLSDGHAYIDESDVVAAKIRASAILILCYRINIYGGKIYYLCVHEIKCANKNNKEYIRVRTLVLLLVKKISVNLLKSKELKKNSQ